MSTATMQGRGESNPVEEFAPHARDRGIQARYRRTGYLTGRPHGCTHNFSSRARLYRLLNGEDAAGFLPDGECCFGRAFWYCATAPVRGEAFMNEHKE